MAIVMFRTSATGKAFLHRQYNEQSEIQVYNWIADSVKGVEWCHEVREVRI